MPADDGDVLARFQAAWQPGPGSLTLLLSGGGDSTALLFLLKQAGHEFGCLHFRHDSPGTFPAHSESFCRALCQAQDVPLEVVRLQAGPLVERGDLSWEAAARHLRYRNLAGRPGTFLTAHTADDQAETVLLRLLDGSGLAGLAGIREVRADGVRRPLLDFRSQELRGYLQDLGQPWMDDPTNLAGNERARLRHEILPFLERAYPSLVASLGRTARGLAADEDALSGLALAWLEQQGETDRWPLEDLQGLAPAVRHRVLREIWRAASDGTRRPLGGVFRACQRLILQGGDDRHVALPGGCKLHRLGRLLWLQPPCEAVPWTAPIPSSLEEPIRAAAWDLFPPSCPVDREGLVLALPAEVFGPGRDYLVRSRLPGDRYRGRSVKTLLAGTGQPPWVRDRWPLLARGAEIVAIPGFACDAPRGDGKLVFRPERWRWRARKMRL
jgi:tRNA(Ile)-lysidine synthase